MYEQYERVWKYISTEEITKLTLDLVKIPSPTGNELEASMFYADYLRAKGIDARLDYVLPNRPNVVAKLSGEAPSERSIMLYGHIDTVPAFDCTPPRVEGGKVYGRGAMDMKGSLAAVAVVLKALKAANVRLREDLWLAAAVGHEAPAGKSEGAKSLRDKILRREIPVDAVFVTEGLIDHIKVAQGGLAIYKIGVSSEEGGRHSGLIPLRANPVLWMGELIHEIGLFDDRLASEPRHPIIVGRPCVNVGIASGGDFYNRIPSLCALEGTVRWNPGKTFHDVERELQSLVKNVEERMEEPFRKAIHFNLDVNLIRDAYELVGKNEVVDWLKKAVKATTGKDIDVIGTRYVSDVGLFGPAGIPTVSWGPINDEDFDLAHSNNECMRIDNLVVLAKGYAALALDLCGVTDS